MAIKFLSGETFKPIKFSFKASLLRNKYAVSNKGRLVSYKEEISDGKILNGTLVQGYKVFKAKPNGENVTLFIHKLVAENFCKKPGKKAEFVVHLDHNKTNNKAENLQWVTRTELSDHLKQSPKLKAYYNRGLKKKSATKKTTTAATKTVAKKLSKPKTKTKNKPIAKSKGKTQSKAKKK